MPEVGEFPPVEHLGRELRIAYRVPAPNRISLTVPVVPEILRPDGAVLTEVLATILDETTGFIAVFSALPDWGSTAALALRFTGASLEPCGELVVDGTVVKAGKRLVFVEADAGWVPGSSAPDRSGHSEGAGRVRVALASGEFAKVGRMDANVGMVMPDPDPDEVHSMALPDSRLPDPYPERLGMSVVDASAGVVELPFTSYARNSSGILHGGVVGALAVTAAEAAAGTSALDAQVQYLSAGRVGPFRTRAELLGDHEAGRLWRTETFDAGDDDRRMTRATVTTRGTE
jgi:acyl-coenzyme A thioesterase PaaI-like protein